MEISRFKKLHYITSSIYRPLEPWLGICGITKNKVFSIEVRAIFSPLRDQPENLT